MWPAAVSYDWKLSQPATPFTSYVTGIHPIWMFTYKVKTGLGARSPGTLSGRLSRDCPVVNLRCDDIEGQVIAPA